MPTKKKLTHQKVRDEDGSVKKDLDEIIRKTEEQNRALKKVIKERENLKK